MVVFLAVSGTVLWQWRDVSPEPSVGHDEPAAAIAEAAGVSPDTLLVDFRDDVSEEALRANAYVEEPLSRFSARDRLYRVRFPTTADAARAAEALRRDATVESVDYDVQASIFPEDLVPFGPRPDGVPECARQADGQSPGFPDDPCFSLQWHLRQVGLPTAWKMGQGQGVTVAVIDTGVTRVPDLAGTEFVAGYNFVSDNNKGDDDHGHGTHVAGTIAQATNNKLGVAGVAFGAKIMPLKVLSAQGSGSMGAIAQAIRFAADNGAQVINMSLGGPFPVTPIRKAIEYATAKGVVVVAAAGNDGKGRVSYPARYPGVIAVASTQFDESTTFYSNWGNEIDIAAPGGNTRVDQNGDGKPDGVLQNTIVPGDIGRTDYLWFMGTSMASPHVAGVAALVVGAGVTRPQAVETVLLGTARKPKPLAAKPDAARLNDRYGAGIVDAGAALKKARLGGGTASVGLGAAAALLGIAGLGRKRRPTARGALGFAGSLVVGALGLLVAPFAGAPLVWSAILPVIAVALLYGMPRMRPALSGFAFGAAGALLFAGLAYVADVRWMPDFLDRAWLLGNAAVSLVLGALVARR